MRISFLVGLAISIIACIIGFFLDDYSMTLKITGFVIAASFIISGILNGSFINGEMFRANYLSETKTDRDKKMSIVKYLIILELPNAVIFLIVLIYMFRY